VGAQYGVDTTRAEVKAGAVAPVIVAKAPAAPAPQAAPAAVKADASGVDSKAVMASLQKNNCTACHAVDKKILGPSFLEIAKKYPGKTEYLAGKIKAGGSGVWGPIPMPAQTLSDGEAKSIAAWLASGAGK
jgi:cytochrome c